VADGWAFEKNGGDPLESESGWDDGEAPKIALLHAGNAQ